MDRPISAERMRKTTSLHYKTIEQEHLTNEKHYSIIIKCKKATEYKSCGCGGIGRHVRFRILCLTTCRFKPCHPHQKRKTPLWYSSFLRTVMGARIAPRFCIAKIAIAAKSAIVFSLSMDAACAEFKPCHPHHRQCRSQKSGTDTTDF